MLGIEQTSNLLLIEYKAYGYLFSVDWVSSIEHNPTMEAMKFFGVRPGDVLKSFRVHPGPLFCNVRQPDCNLQ